MAIKYDSAMYDYFKREMNKLEDEKFIAGKYFMVKTIIDDLELLTANRNAKWSKMRDIKTLSYIIHSISEISRREEPRNENVLLLILGKIYKIKSIEYQKKSKINREMIKKLIVEINNDFERLKIE